MRPGSRCRWAGAGSGVGSAAGSPAKSPFRGEPPTPAVAAANIASVFRMALARRVAARMATMVYERYWEPSWGAGYYFNPKTKQVRREARR